MLKMTVVDMVELTQWLNHCPVKADILGLGRNTGRFWRLSILDTGIKKYLLSELVSKH